MVIIIGGSSHVGKTLLAQKYLEKLNYPYLSLDHLKMGMIRTGKTELTVNDDYEMRYFLWPIAAEMIKTVIENGQNLIVEGCYVPKEWKESFTQEYLDEIRCVFLVMSEEYIREKADEIRDFADVIEKRIDDEVDVDRLVFCSENFKNDCIANGTPYLEISGSYDISEIESMASRLMGI